MSVTAWVSVSIFAGGIFFTIAWWLFRRRVTRLESLEAAVFGATGMPHKYVTHEALNARIGELNLRMAGMAEEGQRREERILEAISNQTLVLGSEVREIKEDIRAQAKRVDTMLLTAAGNSR